MLRRATGFVIAITVWLGTGHPALAAPSGVAVSPVVASSGASVTLAGSGCSSDVHVTATGYLFPGPPAVVADTTVTPAADGTWGATFAMPAVPAYVLAECDGATSAPIVIAPSNAALGNLVPAAVSSSSVVISTSPLVNGSRFAVYTTAGVLLGSDVVAAGVGTVTVPRSLGPANVIAVGLRQADPGIPLPYVPIADFVQLPLPATTTIVVQPAVTTAGKTVKASGGCSGSAHLTVLGRVNGWYDHAPVLVDVHPPVSSAHVWSATFAMPALPSVAELVCTSGGVVEHASMRISPAAGDIPSLVAYAIGGDVGVTLPSQVELDSLHAYTSTGVPVDMTISNDGSTAVARLTPPSRPIRIVIVGIESLGENAEALQNSRVQAWTVDVAAAAAGPTAASPSSRTIPLPATDTTTLPPSIGDRWLLVVVLILAAVPVLAVPRRSSRGGPRMERKS